MDNIDNLDVNPRIIRALKRAKLFNYVTILSMSAPDLDRATQLGANDVSVLLKTVASVVYPKPAVTALQYYQAKEDSKLFIRKMTTGCDIMDQFLRGGILNRGITEVAGESASGKTQFCMQLCLTAQLPTSMGGLNAGAVYICTEDSFPNKRLMQMVESIEKKYMKTKDTIKPIRFTDNIFIEHTADVEGLLACISKKLPLLLKLGKVKLLIIDSIAALFRCEYNLKDTYQRAKQLTSLGAILHSLCEKYGVTIVCINQVAANMKQDISQQKRNVIPALGITWSNIVTTRLILSRTNRVITINQSDRTGKTTKPLETIARTLEVMFAPHLPSSLMYYLIDADGVKGIR